MFCCLPVLKAIKRGCLKIATYKIVLSLCCKNSLTDFFSTDLELINYQTSFSNYPIYKGFFQHLDEKSCEDNLLKGSMFTENILM